MEPIISRKISKEPVVPLVTVKRKSFEALEIYMFLKARQFYVLGHHENAIDHQCSCMLKNDVKRYVCFVQLGVLLHK